MSESQTFPNNKSFRVMSEVSTGAATFRNEGVVSLMFSQRGFEDNTWKKREGGDAL